MKRALTSSLLGLGTVAALFIAGCQSSGAGSSAQAAVVPTTQAISCSKCQVTYVQVPTDAGKGHIVGYSTRKVMECPDCKDAVSNFFATGQFKHTCKTCGDTMELCDAH